eukprot:751750-Hanusia_phi.AAC.2
MNSFHLSAPPRCGSVYLPRVRVQSSETLMSSGHVCRREDFLSQQGSANTTMFFKLEGIPEPPAGYVPPLGSSRNTWTNIYKNKGRIDYCVQQFDVSCYSDTCVLLFPPTCSSSS